MKFLKFSIVLVFLLSLLGAGVTLYLSTLRENEKAKRVYLEGVKVELEGRVQVLESEKAELGQQITDLELKNRDLVKQVAEEKRNYQHAMDLIRDKDLDLQSLRREAEEAHRAFENAQKRNEELERILDELETRMRRVETQEIPPGPEAGFVEVNVAPLEPAPSGPPQVSVPLQPETPSVAEKEEKKEAKREEKKEEIQQATTVTTPPKPPKRRKFFPFFRSSKEEEVKEELTSQPSIQPAKPEPVVTEVKPEKGVRQVSKKESKPVEKIESLAPIVQKEIAPVQLPKGEVQAIFPVKVEAPSKTTQTIAAGSVLLVNRKYNFIVVNLGSKHGLDMDDILSVQRKGSEIAKARVEKLYDEYSAAYIVEERSEQPIGEGDAVAAA